MSDSEDKSVPSPKIEDKKEEEMDQESDNENSRVNGSDSSEDKDNSKNKTEKTEKQDTVESKKEDSSESKSEKTEINDNSEEMETDSPKKSTKKTEETKSKKKKEVKKEDEEDEEDDEDSEPKLGLLEQPVVIESGKREKRKVERLSMTEAYNTPNQPKEVDIPEGVGEKLGDIPRVEFQINKFKAEDLKTLHRVLFGKITAATKVKKNIRLFTGFEFKKDDKEYKKRRDMLLNRNFHMPMLKVVCEVLDLEKKGTKDEVAERVMAFCMEPKSTGKKVPQSKKRKRSETKGKGDKKKTKKDSKSSKKKKSKEKVKGSDDEDDEEEEEEEKSEEEEVDDEEEEEEKEESEEEEVEEEPEEAPKKKKAKKETPAKKPAPAKKETKKKEKPTPQKKKESESEEESEQSSDDEEPLVKKAPSAPTNDELKKLVKKILDGANLEQVTMKTVVKQVYDKFPTFDLSDRKQFIKSTVKQVKVFDEVQVNLKLGTHVPYDMIFLMQAKIRDFPPFSHPLNIENDSADGANVFYRETVKIVHTSQFIKERNNTEED